MAGCGADATHRWLGNATAMTSRYVFVVGTVLNLQLVVVCLQEQRCVVSQSHCSIVVAL